MKNEYSYGNLIIAVLTYKKSWLAFAILLAALSANAATAYTWTGSVDTDWGNSANWSPSAVPTGADDVTIPSSPSGARFPVISSGTFAVGVLTIQAGATVNQTGGVLQETKSFNYEGTFQATAGTFEYTSTSIAGTIATGAVTQFYNVTFNSGADPGFGSTACYLKVSGNWTNNTAVDFLGGNATTVEFNGTANQTIAGSVNTVFKSLVINKSSGAVTNTTNMEIGGDLTVNAGTLDLSTYTANRSTAGGTLSVADGATLILAADAGGQTGSNFPANFTTVNLGTSSFVVYNGSNSITQTVYAGAQYANLSLINGSLTGISNKTATADIVVNGSLDYAAGVIFDMSTHSLAGTLTSITGTGTVQTQNVSSTPIPAGKTWTGTIEFNHPGAAQSIVAGSFNNLTASGSGTKTATGAINVYSDLTVSGSASLASGGYVTLKSIPGKTARLAPVTSTISPAITGDVTVERHIPPKRAFRFLTAPVNSSGSINANWMESSVNPDDVTLINPYPGYGTQITGAGGDVNGFDVTLLNNPSCFIFDNVGRAWSAIPNTTGSFTAGTPYRILIRGDRSIDMRTNNPTPTPTTLRAKGTLVTGNVTMASAGGTAGTPPLSPDINTFNFIGNPYASAVNWLTLDKTDLSASIYVFDPTLSGTNGMGAYVSYNAVLGENSNSESFVDNFIQSGQGLFIQTTGPNPSLTFKETDKAKEDRAVFRKAGYLYNMSIQLLLSSLKVADAAGVYFSEDYNSSIGNEDSYKFTNLDENIAILRDGKTLSLEGRKPIVTTDSIPLRIWQLRQKSYTLRILLKNFASNIQGVLKDKYLNTATALGAGETLVPFSITSDTASFSAQRFKIMFETSSSLPSVLNGIKAYKKNKGVQVEWEAKSESNMDVYEVERSGDAQVFEKIGSAKAKNNPGISTPYRAFDSVPAYGDNFYRIKSVEKSGQVKYSEVVKVRLEKVEGIRVFPNPVQGNNINFTVTDLPSGIYNATLINSTGQRVYTGRIIHQTGTSNHTIGVKGAFPKGIYELLVSEGNSARAIRVFVQ